MKQPASFAPSTNGPTQESTAPVSAAALASTYDKIAWQILVDGQQIKRILSFELQQNINAHHRFELRVYHTELETPRTYRIDQTRELLGKELTVILGVHNKEDITRFRGIITEVSFEEKNGLYGEVVLRGYSPTILLESGIHQHSFYNKNLSSIAGEATESVSGKLDIAINPRFSGNIEYTAQHRESHFEFLNRLSDFHGEWFYYDGQQLHFGRPSRQPEQELQYARHLDHLRMNMQVVPMNFNHIGYRSQEDQVLQQQTSGKVSGLNFYGDVAVQKSDELYQSGVRHHPWQYVSEQGDLDRITKVNKSAQAAQSFSVEGVCRHPSPYPGLRLIVKMGEQELGQYLVTEAVHTLNNTNKYSCTFRALPADVEVFPQRNTPAQPLSEPQIAIVRRNDDPAGQGRVRVQFSWQEGDNMSSWIRVMTPDAGSSDMVNKNRGFVFIPEIGDQVMVGFEHGNPDAPFVLGSLYHGKNGKGGGAENITKSLTTRSGHTIELSDKGAGTHIIIRDPGGNEIFLDTQGKNITITAPETITLNAKNINLNAGENISAVAGMNISQAAGLHIMQNAGDSLSQYAVNDYKATATNIIKIATDSMNVQAKSIEKSAEEMKVDSSKESMTINSGKSVDVKSAEKSRLF